MSGGELRVSMQARSSMLLISVGLLEMGEREIKARDIQDLLQDHVPTSTCGKLETSSHPQIAESFHLGRVWRCMRGAWISLEFPGTVNRP